MFKPLQHEEGGLCFLVGIANRDAVIATPYH